jgi:Flp pilus assembly CpaE family ATPase
MRDGLIPDGEALFDPSRFAPQFSDVQIVSHMERTLRLLDEIDPPEDMRVHVFGVVQAMCSSMSPIEGRVTVVDGTDALLTPNGRRR